MRSLVLSMAANAMAAQTPWQLATNTGLSRTETLELGRRDAPLFYKGRKGLLGRNTST